MPTGQLAAAGGAAALAVDGFWLEPDPPRVVRQEIALRRWPPFLDGFRIALLSDFHYHAIFSVHPISAAIDTVNELRPDLVALTGDFVSEPWFGPAARGARQAEPCAQLLGKLEAPHGFWAIMGNHDASTDPKRVTGALRDVGIQVLLNQSVPIERNGGRFWLGGVSDAVEAEADLAAALQNIPAGEVHSAAGPGAGLRRFRRPASRGFAIIRTLPWRADPIAPPPNVLLARTREEVYMGVVQDSRVNALYKSWPGNDWNFSAVKWPSGNHYSDDPAIHKVTFRASLAQPDRCGQRPNLLCNRFHQTAMCDFR